MVSPDHILPNGTVRKNIIELETLVINTILYKHAYVTITSVYVLFIQI